MIQTKAKLSGKISTKSSISGTIANATIEVFPPLEDLEVTPTLEKQIIKSDMYGFNEVTVNAIEGETLEVNPAMNEQSYEGVFTKVDINAIESDTVIVQPGKEEQTYEGLYNRVMVNGEPNLVPENIPEGISMFGVDGNKKIIDTTDATAIANDIIAPKTAYVNEKKITGTMIATKIYTGAVSTASLDSYSDIISTFDYNRDTKTLVYIDSSSNICFAKVIEDRVVDSETIKKYTKSQLGDSTSNTVLDIKLSKLPNSEGNYYLILVNATSTIYCVEINLKSFTIISKRTITMGHNSRAIFFNPMYSNIVAITGHYTKYSTTNTYMQIINLNAFNIIYSYQGSVSGSYTGTAPNSYWGQWDSTGRYFILNTLVNGSTYGDQRGPNNNQQTLFHFNTTFNGATKVLDKTVSNNNGSRGGYLTTNPLMFYVSANKIYYNNEIYEINGDVATLVKSSAGVNIFNYVWNGIPFNNPMMVSNVGDKVILAYNLYNSSSYQIKIYTFNNSTNTLSLYNSISLSSHAHLVSYLDYVSTFTYPQQKAFIYSATTEIVTELARDDQKFYNTIDANINSTQVLKNTIAFGKDGKIYGTMPNNGTLNYIPSTEAQIIPAGYTSGGTVAGDANFIEENIKDGVTMFGKTGTHKGEGEIIVPQETYNSYVFYSDEEALAYDGYKAGDKALVYKIGTAPFYPKFNQDKGVNTIYGVGSSTYVHAIDVIVGVPNVTLPHQMEIDDGVSWSTTSGTKTITVELWITLNNTECLIRSNYVHSNLNSPITFKFTSTDGISYTFQGVYNSDGVLADQYLLTLMNTEELQTKLLEKWNDISIISKFLAFKHQKVLDKIYTYEPLGTYDNFYKYTLDDNIYLNDLHRSVLKPDQMWFEPVKEPYLLNDVYSLISGLGFEDGTVLYTDTDIAYIFNTYNVELWIDNTGTRHIMSNNTNLEFYEYNLKTKERRSLSREEIEYQLQGKSTIYKKCMDGQSVKSAIRCAALENNNFEWYNIDIHHVDTLASTTIPTSVLIDPGIFQNPSLRLDFINLNSTSENVQLGYTAFSNKYIEGSLEVGGV